jgi:hypothetical protein
MKSKNGRDFILREENQETQNYDESNYSSMTGRVLMARNSTSMSQ